MIVTGKALSRRTVLKGLGAAIGLPFLDAMTPAFARSVFARVRRRCVSPGSTCRTASTCGTGRRRHEGPLGALPAILAPFEPVKKDILVLSNLTAHWGRPLLAGLATTGARSAPT